MNRRGSVFDILAILTLLVVFAIVALFGVRILNAFQDGLSDSGLIDGTGAEILDDQTTRMPTVLDTSFLIIFVLGWVALLVSGYLLNTNPVFFIVALVFNLLILVAAGPIVNVYLEIADSSSLAEYSSQLPASYFILSNIVIVVLAMAISTMIATYAGYRGGGGIGL